MFLVDAEEDTEDVTPTSATSYAALAEVGAVNQPDSNVEFLVVPVFDKADLQLEYADQASPPRFVLTSETFGEQEIATLSRRLVNICGRVNVGKSTVGGALMRLFPNYLKPFPEVKVENQRPIRYGERRGRDVKYYPDEAAFRQAVEAGAFFLAYKYRRSPGDNWQLAGIRIRDLKRVAHKNTRYRYLTIINGLAWSLIRNVFPGSHGFVVVTTPDDYEEFKQAKGVPAHEGLGMNDYGFIGPFRVPVIHPLPNPWLEHPQRDLDHRYSDPLVKAYLARNIFWDWHIADMLRGSLPGRKLGEELMPEFEEHVLEVLWGRKEPLCPS